MKLAPLVIGDLTVKIPIIQGGMGVGISRANLAAAVANEGGMGVISGVQIGFAEPDFETNTLEANKRALIKEIRKAKALSPHGVIGINFLVAMNHYDEIAKTAVDEGIDIIISGAGLPTNLPEIVKGSNTKIAPMASSGRTAAVICKMWDKRYHRIPDLIVVEGTEAGGHLGFSMEDLTAKEKPSLEAIIKDILEVIKPYEEKYDRKIPVVAAGGIFTGKDVAHYLSLGASAVQIATRFIATEECDAHINFKNAIIQAQDGDIKLIKSPVGMPGRALKNKFIEAMEAAPIMAEKCSDCMKACKINQAPYCISEALIHAVNGDVENGLIFSGANAHRITEIVSVKDLMDELVREAEEA